MSHGNAASGGDNPGNNLHVSSLAIRIDQRDLEGYFGKYGVVRPFCRIPLLAHSSQD